MSVDDVSTVPRRAVLGAGCAIATVAATGCGSGSAEKAPPEPFTIPIADVPIGGGVIDEIHGTVVTQPEAGVFQAFSTVCTHRGCAVRRIGEGRIICGCHGSEFRIADGSVAVGPAERPLTARRVTVVAAELHID